jgi:hypothetical protein
MDLSHLGKIGKVWHCFEDERETNGGKENNNARELRRNAEVKEFSWKSIGECEWKGAKGETANGDNGDLWDGNVSGPKEKHGRKRASQSILPFPPLLSVLITNGVHSFL